MSFPLVNLPTLRALPIDSLTEGSINLILVGSVCEDFVDISLMERAVLYRTSELREDCLEPAYDHRDTHSQITTSGGRWGRDQGPDASLGEEGKQTRRIQARTRK